MKKIYLYLVVSATVLAACTENLYKKGNRNFDQLAYMKAIDNFESYLAKRDKPDAVIKLANAYRLVNDIPNAEKWYSKAVQLKESKPLNMFYYAKILMTVEKYGEAGTWFKKYLDLEPDDFVAEMLLASCNTVKSFKQDTSLYTLKEVEIPEIQSGFATRPYESGVMFTGDKLSFSKSGQYGWTGRSYLGLYFSKKDHGGKWLSPMTLKGDVNGDYHEGPACFTSDGNTVYFTRSNTDKNGALRKNNKNENNLKIYTAGLSGDKWTLLAELPFNSDDYSCGHPTLSPDEKTLYFISDMPGGFGGTDLYKTSWNGTGWSKPENLGASVNTAGNEMFPYMHHDGTFYFSSDARNNLGGLDVFMTYYDGKKWLQVENLNYPLNSSADDFGYVLNKDSKTGYIASNRDGGPDKIYEVTKNDPTFILSGLVKHKGKILGIDSALVEIFNISEKTMGAVYSGKTGLYKTRLKPGCEYLIKASKLMYFPVSPERKVSTAGKKISENFNADFELDQIIIEKPIVLQNIYYDLDKWNIRPDAALELDKLVQVLKDNPKIYIELSSHTDSRAGDQYNLILSDKRARAAVDYLASKGIDPKRMKWKGYGETKILNKCVNGVACTEEEYQVNRRTEFKVIKILNTITKL
jgi:peptidoglycan-associated lipoprotein